jgi:ABC-2 type transport system permease protein
MRTIWLVIKHDVATTLRQRSFWFLTLLMPVLLLGVNIYYIIQDSAPNSASGSAGSAGSTDTIPTDMPTIGLVDESGLISNTPPDLVPDPFVRFADNTAARAALEKGDILQYVDIPADYVATGQVTVYARNFQILQSGQNMGVAMNSDAQWVLQYLIDYNLTRNRQVALALHNPTPETLAQFHAISPPQSTGGENRALAEIVSSIVPYMFYFLLLMGSSYLMRSVVAEKENRTAEVLLLSLNPRDLMVGKILAMSVVVLVQIVVWMGGAVLILRRGADLLQAAQFSFPPGFIVWAILFLILGYLLFASIMAAAGALANNAREGGQMTWLLIVPLMPTLMFSTLFLEEPSSPLVLALSLFPFSAPSAMVTRLAVAEVPLWQILVSLAALALTTYLFIVLAGRFFRAGNLLSGESFSWRRLATGWRK